MSVYVLLSVLFVTTRMLVFLPPSVYVYVRVFVCLSVVVYLPVTRLVYLTSLVSLNICVCLSVCVCVCLTPPVPPACRQRSDSLFSLCKASVFPALLTRD